MDFARRNNLGVIALNYSSSAEDLLENRKGYFYPEQGSGQALLDEIKRLYGKDLPIIIYGFSGGAQFVSRFVDWCPDRIIAWCAYSAQFWDYPKSGSKVTQARGIVACGDQDGMRWQPSLLSTTKVVKIIAHGYGLIYPIQGIIAALNLKNLYVNFLTKN